MDKIKDNVKVIVFVLLGAAFFVSLSFIIFSIAKEPIKIKWDISEVKTMDNVYPPMDAALNKDGGLRVAYSDDTSVHYALFDKQPPQEFLLGNLNKPINKKPVILSNSIIWLDPSSKSLHKAYSKDDWEHGKIEVIDGSSDSLVGNSGVIEDFYAIEVNRQSHYFYSFKTHDSKEGWFVHSWEVKLGIHKTEILMRNIRDAIDNISAIANDKKVFASCSIKGKPFFFRVTEGISGEPEISSSVRDAKLFLWNKKPYLMYIDNNKKLYIWNEKKGVTTLLRDVEDALEFDVSQPQPMSTPFAFVRTERELLRLSLEDEFSISTVTPVFDKKTIAGFNPTIVKNSTDVIFYSWDPTTGISLKRATKNN